MPKLWYYRYKALRLQRNNSKIVRVKGLTLGVMDIVATFCNFLKECENDFEINLTNFFYLSDNEIFAEYCIPPYKNDCLKLFFSMTKSITSLAVGIACDMGLLNLDDNIVKYFKDELPVKPHENLSKIKIHHLLSMTSGIHENTYTALFIQDNWIKAFLAQDFPHEPGTFYRYSTHGSHMLSAIIQKASGMTLESFLNKYLFFPMNIFEAQWELSPEGITAGGMGLSLYPQSLVKIAQMLLNGGVYNGKRLISQEYINNATSCHAIKNDKLQNKENSFCGYEYGFQFHICKNGYYRADGAFGQLCLICPQKKIAFIAFSQKSNTEKLLSLIYKYFIETSQTLLIDNYPTKTNYVTSKVNYSIPEGRYKMESNPLMIEYIEFSIDECTQYMKITTIKREETLCFNMSHLTDGKIYFIKDLQEHYQNYICQANWISENILELNVYFIETPYIVKYIISYESESIILDFSINVSMTLKNFRTKGALYNDKLT